VFFVFRLLSWSAGTQWEWREVMIDHNLFHDIFLPSDPASIRSRWTEGLHVGAAAFEADFQRANKMPCAVVK